MCEYNIIELIIDEGIPSEAAAIILDQFLAKGLPSEAAGILILDQFLANTVTD